MSEEPEAPDPAVTALPDVGRVAGIILRALCAPTWHRDADGGRWPTTWQQFVWDLMPAAVAPHSDGVLSPTFEGAEDWTRNLDDQDVQAAYAQARIYRKDADDTTRNLELKAGRLATGLVALLTANVALLVYVVGRTSRGGGSGSLAWAGAVFGIASAAFLVAAVTRAFDADQRMGITEFAGLEEACGTTRRALEAEVRGYAVSNWSRRNKATRLLQARAAVSRAMLCLVVSAALALLTMLSGPASKANPTVPQPRPTATATPTPSTNAPCSAKKRCRVP